MENNNEEKDVLEIDELEALKDENGKIDKELYVTKLEEHLKEQRKKSDEYYEHLKRNMAEFDNFKKRMTKEKESLYYTITSDVISDILPIMDNFEKAIDAKTTDNSYKSGMEMIYTQLNDTLKKLGLEEIQALNITFDPNFHEAVMHVEDENYGEKEVIEVLRKGYKIGDKVIRHSMVKVAN